MLSEHEAIKEKKTTQFYNGVPSTLIYSTIDFFLDFDEKTTDSIWNTLWMGYAIWVNEKKQNLEEEKFRIRPKLLDIPKKKKLPWDYNDYRAESPIKLLNHLWCMGHFREDPFLIYSLKAFAILISLMDGRSSWKEQILKEILLLQYAE